MLKEIDNYLSQILSLALEGYKEMDFFNFSLSKKSTILSALISIKIDKLKQDIKSSLEYGDDDIDELKLSLSEFCRHKELINNKNKNIIDRYSLTYERKISNDTKSMIEELQNEQANNNPMWCDEEQQMVV